MNRPFCIRMALAIGALAVLAAPDDTAMTVDDTGSGRLELLPAEQWGPTGGGDDTVQFRGDSSEIAQAATIRFICGC